MRRTLSWLALACVLVASAASAAPAADQWYTVLLDGRKIGSFHAERRVDGDRVTTTQTLDVSLERAGVSVALGSSESSTETVAGEPISFRSATRMSGIESVAEGRIDNGSIVLETRSGGTTRTSTLPWPKGALLPEGLRLAGVRAGLKPGTRFEAVSFQPSGLTAVPVTAEVIGPRGVDLPGGPQSLTEIVQTMTLSGMPMKTRAWVDREQNVRKLTMPMMGVELTLIECGQACATAPNQSSTAFERTLATAPRPLTKSELAGAMRYTLAATSGDPLRLPDTDEQSVMRDGDRLSVVVRPYARASARNKPTPNDLAANDWLQSDHREIVELAGNAVRGVTAPAARMKRLEQFVRGYITKKNLSVGYASALEVVRKPEGDCTEHALLLAALGRAIGIPTRVADGLAYAPGFAGKDSVFVPHAWAQAWIDGRWQSFDAALPGFDAGHIVLAVGNGDPAEFYAGLGLLGRIRIERADPVLAPATDR